MCNWLGTIWRVLQHVWNTGTLCERENKARDFVTCTQLSGFTQPVLLPMSNPYYLLHRVTPWPRSTPDVNGIYQVCQHCLRRQGDMFGP